MDKPRPFKTVRHPHWDTPIRVPSYDTYNQYWTAINDWAKTQRRFTVVFDVAWEDGSVSENFHEFQRFQKEVSFQDPWGECSLEVMVDTGKFEADIFDTFIPGYDEEKGSSLAQCRKALRAYVKIQVGNGNYKITERRLDP
jgi:hypothetical protein